MKANKNNLGNLGASIILLYIILAVVLLLGFQYIFLSRINREHAFATGEVLTDQIGTLLDSNDRKQQVLIETLKEDYISKAKAVAYFIDNDPKSETDLPELNKIAQLMSIDEIHLFNEKGEIYSGTVPKYYGYSFDSGEQMAYFKPMLTDKTLSMCQDVTPNTAESKSMMYAICWNGDGSRMIQIGIEPLRLIEELHANQISEVVDSLPVNTGTNIIVADEQTGIITGSTLPEFLGLPLSESGIPVQLQDDTQTANYISTLNNDRVYNSVRKTERYRILVTQSVKAVNEEMPKMMLVVFLYLLLSSVILIFTVQKLTVRIHHEKRKADTDAMTGMKNRRAYEDDILYLKEEPKTKLKDLVCMMIDINELKMLNDRYGHDTGDKAIKGFAEIIDKTFGSYGNIYRMGGDEFAAFLFVDTTKLTQLIENAEAEITEWSAENNIRLSMSHGAASTEEFPDLTVEELTKIADERMYKSKSLFYQNSGHDRRQHNRSQTDQ